MSTYYRWSDNNKQEKPMRILALILGFIIIVLGITFAVEQFLPHKKPEIKFTRICAWSNTDNEVESNVVCNDYPNWLYPNKFNGCTEITITGADSEICGNYTLERRSK